MNLLISLSALCLVLFSLVPAHAETAKIVLKEAALREQCRFLAPSVAKLQYNDNVTIISREGDWVESLIRKDPGVPAQERPPRPGPIPCPAYRARGRKAPRRKRSRWPARASRLRSRRPTEGSTAA
ncbi:MAG: hypothetical protein MZU79_03110 [Anaerotruncus sp.]|nr:hypothetical protein [Anaerotruncus sp.]